MLLCMCWSSLCLSLWVYIIFSARKSNYPTAVPSDATDASQHKPVTAHSHTSIIIFM